MKYCSKCKKYKPLENFRPAKSPWDKLYTHCYKCDSLYKKEYRVNNREELNRKNKEFYQLNKERYAEHNKNYDKGKKRSCDKRYRETERGKAVKKESDLRRKDKIKIYNSEYRKANTDRLRQIRKEYYEQNRDKYSAQSKTYKSSDEGKEIVRLSNKSRAARKKSLASDLTLSQWKECETFFNLKCAYCGNDSNALTQDHFIPIVRGGGYTKSNIIPSCKSCNFSKNDSDFFDWYPRQTFYTEDRESKILEYLNITPSEGDFLCLEKGCGNL